MATPTLIAGYLLLFFAVGGLFVGINLLIGRLVRPHDPNEEKTEIYECGEPTIGSSFVQFDLRFYVVALVFIIFDVEVAFLFPWANAFGKAAHLQDADFAVTQAADGSQQMSEGAQGLYAEMGLPVTENAAQVSEGASQLVTLAAYSGTVFFLILIIGFAYEWKTGALDWVRAVTAEKRQQIGVTRGQPQDVAEPVLSA